MFHGSDFEFFQNFVQWSDPTVEEAVPSNVYQDTQKTLKIPAHTSFPPQSWDYFNSNSSSTQGMYTSTSNYPVPVVNYQSVDFNTELIHPHALINENKSQFQLQALSAPIVPEVINRSTSQTIEIQPPPASMGWLTYDADFTNISDVPNSIPFKHQCSSRNMRNLSVVQRGVEKNQDKSENIINNNWQLQRPQMNSETNTDLLETMGKHNNVEKMKIEEGRHSTTLFGDRGPLTMTDIENAPSCSYNDMTPKCETECRDNKESPNSRLHDSEDSETHNAALTPSKYKIRKHDIPINDMIRGLEESLELTKVRRGRPPKRLDLNLFTISTQEQQNKYRVYRNKNNEASKRSRLSRKYKEQQMEQLSEYLEERNEQLRIRARMLEDAVKMLRETFLTAVSQRSQCGSIPGSLN